jgi:polar amino acid transport system substrate-binding protein
VRALVLVLALVIAGCGAGDPAPRAEQIEFTPPQPVGANVMDGPAPTTTGQPAPPCDPTASLRPAGPPVVDGAGPTVAAIAQRGRLRVGVDQNSYRFGFRNPFTGELEGFDIDVARQVAAAIFGDPTRIQFVTLLSGQRIDALRSGNVDIVVQTMTSTCERRQEIDFSTIYYQAGQRVLVNRGSPVQGPQDLGGRRVCAASGSTSIQNLADAPAGPVPVGVPSWTDCLVMLQQGQVEAVSTDDTILAGLRAQDPSTEIVGPRFSTEPYGIGVRKQREDLVRFVNAVLERMRADGTWTRIYDDWLTPLLGPPPRPPVARYLP